MNPYFESFSKDGTTTNLCLDGYIIFHYLDRSYIPKNFPLPSLNDVALSCFRDLAFNKVKDEVTNVIISLIRQEREGNNIDSSLLKNVLDM